MRVVAVRRIGRRLALQRDRAETGALQRRNLGAAGMLGVDAVTDGLAANAARDQSGRAAATGFLGAWSWPDYVATYRS